MVLVLPSAVGGHLVELLALARRLPAPLDREHRRWMTWPTAQSRSLLAGEDVVWIDPVEPRDVAGVVRAAVAARRLVADGVVTSALSTGSAVALGVFPVLAAAGVRCHFVESATRTWAPSLTGRLLAPVPGVRRYTQHRAAARPSLPWAGSVFDGFTRGPDRPVGPDVATAVVSVGTMRGHPFRRLVAGCAAALPDGAEVLWQTGCTPLDGLTRSGEPLPGRDLVPPEDLSAAMAVADVVIAHAGVGTAIAALRAGRCPVLVPRAAGVENVDGHQGVLAADLVDRGLAVVSDGDPAGLRRAIAHARRRTVVRAGAVPPLSLLAPLERRV